MESGYFNNPKIVARWALRQSAAPSVEPVTTAEAKTHLHIDGTDEDTKIGLLITAAREYVEKYLQRALINRTYVLYLDRVPVGSTLELPMPDLVSITHVKYYDTDDSLQTFSSANYRADTMSHVGRVTLKSASSWPVVISDRTDALQVTYVAGYGAATTDIPQPIRNAIMMLVEHWYINRGVDLIGATSSDLDFAIKAILDMYKVPNL